MRLTALAGGIALAAMSCGGSDNSAHDAAVDAYSVDAPDTAPTLTSFYPMPSTVTPGVPTAVTWNWTYLVEPPFPTPTCTIDNGIGEVTRGQMTTLTLNATTAYRLTCTNRVGTTARDTVVTIPPAAPLIATFTATPSPLVPNAATAVTFSWTYSNVPSPPPTCTIDTGIGAATSGMMATLTLPQARTFRLRCQNTQGTATRDVTVAVNECTGGTHDCGATASCNDTTDGFTCACNTGYSGNGDVCSATNLTCTTPGVCSPNASCVGTNTCVCNPGYIGDGLTCTRARLTFITSTTGTGNLSTWIGATGTGLAAADSICAARATAAALPGTYVAWMSDANDDAYCRVHGLLGKRASNCGQGALPATAGPWVRTDSARQPAAPTIDKWLAPTRQTLYPVTYTELGSDVTVAPLAIWTGTDDTGALTGAACGDWTSADSTGTIRGAMGDINGGGTSWTDLGTDPTCSSLGRLRCVEVAAGTGPALSSRHPAAKKAFLTSVSGTALLGSWADALGLTGISAADAICQARARFAGYANANLFKAWISSGSFSASGRIASNGPWARPDGVVVATTRTDLFDGRLAAPLYLTESSTYAAGNAESGSVWTGSSTAGFSSGLHCSSWLTTSGSGTLGRHDTADAKWASVTSGLCSATDYRLYCFEDQ